MSAKKHIAGDAAPQEKKKLDPRITRGNIWTIVTIVAGVVGGTGYQHFTPSVAAQEAHDDSQMAVEKAAQAATRAALIESTVSTHTSELNRVAASVDILRLDVAVLKSQGSDSKISIDKLSDKMDKMLIGLSRMQGASRAPSQPQ